MTTSIKTYLAIDLGASSGRLIAGHWNNSTLSLEEVHRFNSPCVQLGRRLHWDVMAIYNDIIKSLQIAATRYGDRIVSVGTDTWGVDYALLDENGELLSNPIAYRDERTKDLYPELRDRLGKEAIYASTGIQFMFFNTLYQLYAEKVEGRTAYKNADRLLFIPDLINYWLSDVKATERSVASTSQMLNPHTGDWDPQLLEEVGANRELLGDIVESGTVLGPLSESITKQTKLKDCSVVVIPGHDTASAFAATPFNDRYHATLSSGTWSIMGIERTTADTSEKALEAAFSNEIGHDKTVRFLKNICGMWLLEESRRFWITEGIDYDYATLVEMAQAEEPLAHLIDPDAPEFATPGNIPQRIKDYCQSKTGKAPENEGQVIRCIFDSLATKYRIVFKQLGGFSSQELKGLHIVGGGSQNKLLNQLTADAIGKPVIAGPIETTAFGNLIVQLIADKQIKDLNEGREVVRRSETTESYHPRPGQDWSEAESRLREWA